jgi:hypothetical protein
MIHVGEFDKTVQRIQVARNLPASFDQQRHDWTGNCIECDLSEMVATSPRGFDCSNSATSRVSRSR